MNPRPTLRDVARQAGNLHPSTASRALHNDPAISPETRTLVLRAAASLGYHPDPLLDAFNQHRKEVRPQKSVPIIAFVGDFESREALLLSPLHAATWAAARISAERLHCRVELFLVGPRQLRPERLSQILHTRCIGSVIVGACQDLHQDLRLQWELFCCVRIGALHLAEPRRAVATDLRGAARFATRGLLAAGCRRIGLLAATPRSVQERDFIHAGYLLEATSANMTPSAWFSTPESPAIDHSSLFHWIASSRLDGVICDDPALIDVLRQGHFPCAALDATFLPTDVAGAVHDYGHIGSQAVEQVVSLARANQRGAGQAQVITLIPVTWRDGASLYPKPSAAKSKPRRPHSSRCTA